MKTVIALGAALTLGAALVSVPASAQQATPYYGRSFNDGGLVPAPSRPAPKPLYNSTTAATPHYGRAMNDGGLVDQPSAAQLAAARAVSAAVAKQKPAAPRYGRALNDGGLVN